MNRLVLPIIAALLVLAVPGCAAEKTEGGGGSHKKDKFNVILDYFPNADHAGIYAAQAAGDYDRAGLDVDIKPPPDPSRR
jgi:putative hydroxymethylpyrimidine transport system substrate-binding protein